MRDRSTWRGSRLWPLLLSTLLGVLAGAGLYTLYYARAAAYLSDDPQACANCHVMRDSLDSWRKSSHEAHATCNDCHVPHRSLVAKWFTKAENGARHAYAFTVDEIPEPIRAHAAGRNVVLRNCVRCHAEMVGQILFGPHALHGGERADCIRCHRQVGHGAER